jgi:HEPN domain-containing protein
MIDEGVKKWIVKAMEDFKIANHELGFPKDEVSTGPVCFHCQQVVEKLLKAYLVSKNIDFEKTHDLEFLLELCVRQEDDFEKLNIGNLMFYAIEVRYPDEFYIPSLKEARECFEIAGKIKDFVFKKLGIKDKDLQG